MISMTPAPCSIAGIPIHPILLDELCDGILHAIASEHRIAVMYGNMHAINLAQHDTRFRAALHSADVVFCDGQGVRLAANLLGCRVPQRFTPPDWIDRIALRLTENSYNMFLLGGRPGVAEKAAQQLCSRFPELHVATHHGYFDKQGPENEKVRQYINASGANILFVGMGMPLQECWIHDNLPYLSVNVAMPVGALFDYVAGLIPRGPRWLTDYGFEWLCRLWFEPRRLWRRYLLGIPTFGWLILRQRLGRRYL